jgi:hypothetical protein
MESVLSQLIKNTQRFGYALQYVKDQTPEICAEAVKQYDRVLQFVKDSALQFVTDQTPEICIMYVKRIWFFTMMCRRFNCRKSQIKLYQ